MSSQVVILLSHFIHHTADIIDARRTVCEHQEVTTVVIWLYREGISVMNRL